MELIIRAEQPGDELAIRDVLLTAFATAQEAELVDRSSLYFADCRL